MNAMGVAGDLSMQARAIDLAQYPVYQDNAEAGNYHMLLWPQAQASAATLWFNQSYADDNYRTLFQDIRFRRAMSRAIDRDQINQVAFLGQGFPQTITVVPDSPYYDPAIANVDGEYDPALATSLLDDIGLTEGCRRLLYLRRRLRNSAGNRNLEHRVRDGRRLGISLAGVERRWHQERSEGRDTRCLLAARYRQ